MLVSSSDRIVRNAPSLEPFGMLTLFSMLVALPAVAMVRTLEPALVLPAFSILLFGEAAIAALVARLIQVRENSSRVTLWDFAGAFTLIGCAAAIFGEPDQAALFFEEQVGQRPDLRLQ